MAEPGFAVTVLKALFVLSLLVATRASPTRCKRAVRQRVNCPMNVTMTMPQETILRQLYPGLFLTGNENVYDKAFKIKSYRVVRSLPTRPCKNGVCYKSNRVKRDTSGCCDTETNLIQLISLEKDGMTYSVVHLPDGTQYLTENSCSSEDANCSTGTCKSLLGLHWVLVTDPNVAYYPPVRFVMVEFKMGCSCEP